MKSKFTCPVCGSARYVYLFSGRDRMYDLSGVFSLVQCHSCSLVLQFPLLSAFQVSRYYPSNKYYAYEIHHSGGFFARLRTYLISYYYNPTLFAKLLSAILPRVPAIPIQKQNGKILDVGCGAGDTLVLLKHLGWETYGIDIDKKAVHIAKNRGVDFVKVGSYRDLSKYPNNYFDAVRLYHVIEHLDDPNRCIALMYKKLKKGGQLIIGTPNVASIASRVFRTYWYNVDLPRHLVLFSPTTISKIVERMNFSGIRIEFCSAGGILGSIQYVVREKLHKNWNLIHNQWLVMLFYPVEGLLDLFGLGDVFVIRATK